MELRQLAYFVAVAEEASFTKAAARVRVSQPGVSAQVRQLERELGQPLLDRSGGRVRLTEVGEAVLPYARAALAAAEGARLAVDELTGLLGGRVSVGMVTSCGPLGLPGVLADFHRDHPAVEITLTEDTSDRLVEGVRTGGLDAAVIGLGSQPPTGIGVQVVIDEPLVAVMSREDALAGHASLRLDALRDRPLISLPVGTGLRASLEQGCRTAGFAPRVTFEAGDPTILAQLATRGLGVAVLPASLAPPGGPGPHAVPLTAPALRGRLALAWRAHGPVAPAARALITHVRAALPDRSGDT